MEALRADFYLLAVFGKYWPSGNPAWPFGLGKENKLDWIERILTYRARVFAMGRQLPHWGTGL